MDLLEYAQQLIQQGNSTSQVQALRVYLQELVQKQPNETKIEIKPATTNNNQIPTKSLNTNNYLLVGGLFLLLGSFLAIGY